MNPKQLKDKRARLLREAGALKNTDGTFADDTKRQAFDAKMAEIEALDGNRSETLAERDPLDPGAPLGRQHHEWLSRGAPAAVVRGQARGRRTLA
jgi:hypothetical protein